MKRDSDYICCKYTICVATVSNDVGECISFPVIVERDFVVWIRKFGEEIENKWEAGWRISGLARVTSMTAANRISDIYNRLYAKDGSYKWPKRMDGSDVYLTIEEE